MENSQQFQVLDRHLDLHRHYLLEASAGTGKTFSIQNIVTRLLIECDGNFPPLQLDQILVVTFTRAATRELKARIHANLVKILHLLESWLNFNVIEEGIPDFLKGLIEQGKDSVKAAKKRLQKALFSFDRAQIFTIHAFCARMLKQYAIEGDIGFHAKGNEKSLPNSEILMVMRDFLRTEVHSELYSVNQIEKLLSGDRDQTKLLKAVRNSSDIIELPSYKALFDQFKAIMDDLKKSFSLTSEKLIQDYDAQVDCFKNHSQENKKQTKAKIGRFASLFDKQELVEEDFDQIVQDQLVWPLAFDSKLLKKHLPDSLQLNYPDLTQNLRARLLPIVEQAGDFSVLLARLAKDFKGFLKRYQNEEEKLSPDDFLLKMSEAAIQPSFLKKVQESYTAAVIDEFQDTDALQWNIFRRLFLPEDQTWKGYLYLVGDPKQSIYSFRQADIYTYLAAAQALGPAHCYTLDVNYRSHSTLIDGLNALFDYQNIPSLIPLPKTHTHLTYKPVKAHECALALKEDTKGAVHFFVSNCQEKKFTKLEIQESHFLFPFIINEIIRLKENNQMQFGQFAILVRDRHQAARLCASLDECAIPYVNQRRSSLIESKALQALTDLMHAVLYPKNHSSIKVALGGPLIGWHGHEIYEMQAWESILLAMQNFRQHLMEKGFTSFFDFFLQWRCPHSGKTILERILSREKGLELFQDLQQLADLIIENQNIEWHAPEGIISFLDQLKIWDEDEDERLQRMQDLNAEGVKILTLHYSKGLEFDVVFALGLINRKKNRENLVHKEVEGRRIQTPSSIDEEAFLQHLQECDAEKMRQLYVALTRAKFRLYIPLVQTLFSESLQLGEASALDLFLARFKSDFKSYHELYEQIRFSAHYQPLIDFIIKEGSAYSITYEMLENTLGHPMKLSNPSDNELIFPKPVVLNHQNLFVTSYSGIVHQQEEIAVNVPRDQLYPQDYHPLVKTVHNLPANAETGILIHSLLETCDFQNISHCREESEILPFIKEHIDNTLYQEWGNVLASLIYRTLKTPLKNAKASLCLTELKPYQIYREMPFLFSFDHQLHINCLNNPEGLIKGVIDLAFIHEERYYLVDWKTNWLGANAADYNRENLEKAMHENNYFVQAKIYRKALEKFIKVVDNRPFEECFGGIFYLFLRGMSPESNFGIYAID